MERYIGEIIEIEDPAFEDIEIVWMTGEYIRDKRHASVWIIHEGRMIFGLSKKTLELFQDYEDMELPSGRQFDCWNPGKEEWDYMIERYGYEYRALDYHKAMQGDLDEWCDFELDFVSRWNRDKKIEYLLKGKE